MLSSSSVIFLVRLYHTHLVLSTYKLEAQIWSIVGHNTTFMLIFGVERKKRGEDRSNTSLKNKEMQFQPSSRKGWLYMSVYIKMNVCSVLWVIRGSSVDWSFQQESQREGNWVEPLFLERGEKVRKGEKHQLVASCTCLRQGLACNPGMCHDQEAINWGPFALWDDAQPTEPCQSRLELNL